MSTPKPSGITAQVIRPREWYTVSWDDVAGADYYECQHQDEAHVSQLRKPESALIAVPRGTRRFTAIRNVVGGEPSGWVRVTLNDEGSIVDIDGDDDPPPDKPPNPPRNPQATEVVATSARLVWDAPTSGGTPVDHYHVSWSKAGGSSTGEDTSDNPELLVTGLDADSDYGAAVSAVSAAGSPSKSVPVYWHTEADEVVPPPEQPPNPPTGLRVTSTEPEYASVSVVWNQQDDADYFEVLLDNVFPRYRKANSAEYTFSDLTDGQTYTWRVRAVRKASGGKLLRSTAASSEFTYEGEKPPPPPTPVPRPRNVRAHCISHNSTKVEWDLDAQVIEYEVWLGGAEEAAQRTQDTLVTISGLTSNTSYTAYVVAYDEDGRSSEPGSVAFKTGLPEPPPDEDPDADTAADWPAPRLEVVPTQNGRVRATWDDPATSEKPTSGMGFPFWHVSLDQRTWYFTRERQYEFDVGHGGELFVSVYGVWDNTLTGIATQGVAL